MLGFSDSMLGELCLLFKILISSRSSFDEGGDDMSIKFPVDLAGRSILWRLPERTEKYKIVNQMEKTIKRYVVQIYKKFNY